MTILLGELLQCRVLRIFGVHRARAATVPRAVGHVKRAAPRLAASSPNTAGCFPPDLMRTFPSAYLVSEFRQAPSSHNTLRGKYFSWFICSNNETRPADDAANYIQFRAGLQTLVSPTTSEKDATDTKSIHHGRPSTR